MGTQEWRRGADRAGDEKSEPTITYDHLNRRVIIRFHWIEYNLAGIYRDEFQARKAGEEFCRRLGWSGPITM